MAGSWLVGGGEMGELIREKDWSATPLGPIEGWPQSLRTAVGICLASNFPIDLIWGPGRTQIYNDGYWPICGAKHPRSMGQDFRECWASAWPSIGAAFAHASAGEADFIVNDRIFLDRDGYLEETFFTYSFSPMRDESGGIAGLFHPVTEITEQTLAERRLEVLRELADQTADAKTVRDAVTMVVRVLGGHDLDVPFALLYLLDPDGRLATLGGSTGVAPGLPACPPEIELEGSAPGPWPLAELLARHQPVEVADLDGSLGLDHCGPYPEPPRSAFLLPITISGLARPLGFLVAGVSARRALDAAYRTFFAMLGGGVTNALANARSYEEETRRAEALAELDRAKTTFFSNVSHELRTPLTLTLGPIEEILSSSDAQTLSISRQELEMARRNGLRLVKLVNTMLDFSRIQAGRIEASYEPVDLGPLTAELASMFRSAIESAGMALVVDCPPLGEPVLVDRDMWEKIVLNLVSNAFKYTIEGQVEVRLRLEGRAAVLRVRDTGVGIDPDQLGRVFERFYRVPESRGRTNEGTGIGLALVRELVQLHGGTVDASSVPGVGSELVVRMPTGTAHLPSERIGRTPELPSTRTAAGAFVEEALRWLPDPAGTAPPGASGTAREWCWPRTTPT